MTYEKLQEEILSGALDIIEGGAARDEALYRAYSWARGRGIAHDAIAHQYPDADKLRQRYVDACNTGARAADDCTCQRCGARGDLLCRSCAREDSL